MSAADAMAHHDRYGLGWRQGERVVRYRARDAARPRKVPGVVAACRCGWASTPRARRATALRDYVRHLLAATGGP